MRVAEHGAKALAIALKLKEGKGKDLPYPVELCDWGMLARAFRTAIDKLPSRKTIEASKLVSFYNDTVVHFSALKDARNRISHSRERAYDKHETKSVFDNVEHFMKQISKRLTESGKRADNAAAEN